MGMFRKALESLPGLAWLCRVNGECYYLSRKWLAYTGAREDELYGLGWQNVIHPDDRARVAAAWGAVAGKATPYEARYRLRRHDGAYRWFRARGEPMTDEAGRLVGFSGLTVDIDDEVRREQTHESLTLHASEERFRQLADSMPQLVWTAEPDGTVDYYNERHKEFAGFEQRPDGSWRWDPVLHPDDQQATVEAWLKVVRTGEKYEIAHRVKRTDGKYRWYLSRGTPFRDGAGRVVKWYGTATDIDDQKRAEAALREVDRRKTEFLAMLSHELRNPLAPIKNSLYILEHAAAGGEQANRARVVIDRQVGYMARLIDDLLDVTRISQGKIRLQRERVELNGIVQRTVEDHRSLFAKNGVQFEVEVTEHPLHAEVDPIRIAQVVGNLLQNAAKFTPPGGRTVLSLEARGDGRATIQVRDTGAGMAPEILTRAFEPFIQADQTLDRSGGGLGLGLALVKGLVELHGGRVDARSEGLGKGAEFTVELPIERHSAPRLELRPPAPAVQTARRVLLIEDNADAAESLKEALELGGHVVEVANAGPEGIEKARTFKPDIVLCDIGLPGIDGYEVARRMRADSDLRRVALVALSGYALPEDQKRSREAGFDRHLAKPPDLGAIEKTLAEVPAPAG